jgi:hypothetical protein
MTASAQLPGKEAVVADQIGVEPGALPWKPSGDSELAETYAYYDQPILGLIRQATLPYAFRCVDLVGNLTMWAYALIEEDDVARLDDADDLPSALAEVTAGKPFTVALADEEAGIFEWWYLDEELEGSPSILDSAAIRRALLPIVEEHNNRLTHVREHVVEELTR